MKSKETAEEYIKWVLDNHSEHEDLERSILKYYLEKVKDLVFEAAESEIQELQSKIQEQEAELTTYRSLVDDATEQIQELEEKISGVDPLSERSKNHDL